MPIAILVGKIVMRTSEDDVRVEGDGILGLRIRDAMVLDIKISKIYLPFLQKHLALGLIGVHDS